jgi:hypothetical protein
MSSPLLKYAVARAETLRDKPSLSLWQATALELLDRVCELEMELAHARMFPELPEGAEAKRRLEQALLEDGEAAHENYCKKLRRGR